MCSMISFKRGHILRPFISDYKFLSKSTRSVCVSELRSKHTNTPGLKATITARGIRQNLQCLPKSQNFTCKHPAFLQSRSILRASCAEFHSDEDRTYVTLLNREEKSPLMVDSFSQHGFRLNNGLAVVGAIALFPKSLLSWNVGSAAGITKESLSLFYMIAPKIDLLVLGIGDPGTKFDLSLLPFMRDKGISLEVLPTEKAVATYNFLTEEGRSVAGAFIPPQELRPTAEDQADAIMKKRRLFESTIEDEFL